MNAIKLYISVARLILENENYDQSICREINNILPHLEQSLTCTVCRSILHEPFSPTDTVCQHHVCNTCVGGRKALKPSCSWCKDYSTYVKNTQLQCLLACYKALCNFVKHSNLLNQLNGISSSADTNRSVSRIVQNGTELPLKIKKESYDDTASHQGRDRHHPRRENSSVQNHYVCGNSSNTNNSNEISRLRIKQEPRVSSSVETDGSTNLADARTDPHPSRLRSGSLHTSNMANVDKLSDSNSEEMHNSKAMYSISFTGTRSNIILKRKHIGRRDPAKDPKFVGKDMSRLEQGLSTLNVVRTLPQQPQKNSSPNENSRFCKLKTKQVNKADRPTCRCGNATPKPGKLTCCGQRCACYMQNKACLGCRCQGCRNPHMMDGVKILGRYAQDNSPEPPNRNLGSVSSYLDLSGDFLNDQVSQMS